MYVKERAGFYLNSVYVEINGVNFQPNFPRNCRMVITNSRATKVSYDLGSVRVHFQVLNWIGEEKYKIRKDNEAHFRGKVIKIMRMNNAFSGKKVFFNFLGPSFKRGSLIYEDVFFLANLSINTKFDFVFLMEKRTFWRAGERSQLLYSGHTIAIRPSLAKRQVMIPIRSNRRRRKWRKINYWEILMHEISFVTKSCYCVHVEKWQKEFWNRSKLDDEKLLLFRDYWWWKEAEVALYVGNESRWFRGREILPKRSFCSLPPPDYWEEPAEHDRLKFFSTTPTLIFTAHFKFGPFLFHTLLRMEIQHIMTKLKLSKAKKFLSESHFMHCCVSYWGVKTSHFLS